MNVLSLFDGMSCGQLAMKKQGIEYSNYYASEIDKYAISITQKNFPNTIQLGDVSKINIQHLPKIDLLIGGSPCQGFSFAGRQLNFEDPRSKLFFEFVRILNTLKSVNPNIKFLLENVKMRKEFSDIISEHLGVKPVVINSSLVSAQNRVRLYWTNIGEISQPADTKVYLRDILEETVDNKYYLPKEVLSSVSIPTEDTSQDIPVCINSKGGRAGIPNLQPSLQDRIYSDKGKFVAVTPSFIPSVLLTDNSPEYRARRLTPVECERLQTVPDNYTEGVSKSQRYRMLGNGWTVDVISHLLSSLNK